MKYRADIVKQILDKDGIVPSSNPLYESEIIVPYLTGGFNKYESELLFKNMDGGEPEHPNVLSRVTLEENGDASFFPYKQLSYANLENASSGTNIKNIPTGNNYGFIFKVTSPMKLSEKFSGTVTYTSVMKVNINGEEVFKDTMVIEEKNNSLNSCLANINEFKITLEKGYYLFSFYYEPSKTLHYNDGVLVNLNDIPLEGTGEMN